MIGQAATAATPPQTIATGLTYSPPTANIRIGIAATGTTPTGQPTADIFLTPTTPPAWETLWHAQPNDLIPTTDFTIQILAITPPTPGAPSQPGSPGHGSVTLQTLPNTTLSTPRAYLAQSGRLKLPNPDPMQQFILRIASLQPNSATLTWVPEPLSFGDATPADIHQATIHPGTQLTIAATRITILAITPAWVELVIAQ